MYLLKRKINQNTALILFVLCATLLFVVLIIQTQRWDSITKSYNNRVKNNKNCNSIQEEPENNALNSIRSTNDNRLKFPSLSRYLPYINDEESVMIPAYVLSKRQNNKRGIDKNISEK